MKKWLVVLLVIVTLVISACSDGEDNKGDEEQNLNETMEGNNTSEEEKKGEEETENDSSIEDEDSEDSSGPFETQTEDQLDLAIGDTGKFDTDLTTYEITLNGAEIKSEVDDITSQLDDFIILDITVKNTGDKSHTVQDLLYGLEVTFDLESTGYQDYSEDFPSLEKLEGELSPGEQTSGEFITEIPNAEEYFFRLRSGITGAGSSNEVIWTIPAEQAK
ncbi:DUF4352 domain-containing protein [Oceanobacillus jordanicus]|uniref:DUF4352 domain-containing protein n=1 Tax=Oceanobacillus jordanicus TaxID=2867266 RepID=A0AAW5B8P0_9BACI|nr:DUF4352 domain-containing protein [Oceanobacillus jordanicus]MCG3420736.1 DUF4352 domain-containing protein [Oceanobacillus jordanicus]